MKIYRSLDDEYTVIAMKPYRHRDETRVLLPRNYMVYLSKVCQIALKTAWFTLHRHSGINIWRFPLTFSLSRKRL